MPPRSCSTRVGANGLAYSSYSSCTTSATSSIEHRSPNRSNNRLVSAFFRVVVAEDKKEIRILKSRPFFTKFRERFVYIFVYDFSSLSAFSRSKEREDGQEIRIRIWAKKHSKGFRRISILPSFSKDLYIDIFVYDFSSFSRSKENRV